MQTSWSQKGQATVEAALLLPIVLTFLAFLIQPACVLYTKSVMASTAGELTRLVTTARGSEEDTKAYALRRLAAVPNLTIFHEGGPEAWDIQTQKPDDAGYATAKIDAHVRLLPIFGVLGTAFGEQDDQGLHISVEIKQRVRAEWIGGSYEDWIDIWG